MLNDNRSNIVDAFARAAAGFATIASRMLQQTKDDFAADFKDLYPVIKALNDNADDFIKDLEFLPTFPFHYKLPAQRGARRLPERVRDLRPHGAAHR